MTAGGWAHAQESMITESNAVEIARARSRQKGWAFVEPVHLVPRLAWSGGVTRYEIETNAGKLGAKSRFVIDATSGASLSEGYVSR